MTSLLDAFSLIGRVALVTGAARGLGYQMARTLAQAGAEVHLNSRDEGRAGEAVAQLRGEGLTVVPAIFDVADEVATDHAVASIHEAAGRLDILVNNVGARMRRPVSEISPKDLRALLNVDLVAAFNLARICQPIMAAGGYGRIVMVSSIAAVVGQPGDAAYIAAKGGMEALVRALACEFGPSGVTCNALAPGPFTTEANAVLAADPQRSAMVRDRVPLGRWGDPAEIGPACLYLAAPASAFVTGSTLTIDGGLSISGALQPYRSLSG